MFSARLPLIQTTGWQREGHKTLSTGVSPASSRFDPSNGHRDGRAATVGPQIHLPACTKPQEMQFASERYTGADLGKSIL